MHPIETAWVRFPKSPCGASLRDAFKPRPSHSKTVGLSEPPHEIIVPTGQAVLLVPDPEAGNAPYQEARTRMAHSAPGPISLPMRLRVGPPLVQSPLRQPQAAPHRLPIEVQFPGDRYLVPPLLLEQPTDLAPPFFSNHRSLPAWCCCREGTTSRDRFRHVPSSFLMGEGGEFSMTTGRDFCMTADSARSRRGGAGRRSSRGSPERAGVLDLALRHPHHGSGSSSAGASA